MLSNRKIRKAKRNMAMNDDEPVYRIQKQTFRDSFSCWNATSYTWPVKLNAVHKLQQKVTEWTITVKIVKRTLNLILEVEGEATGLQFILDKCYCRIEVINNSDEMVASHKGNMEGAFHDRFNFKNLFNLSELYTKSPNLYHQIAGRPNTLVLALTIGPRKDDKRSSNKTQKRMLDEEILTDTVIKTKTSELKCHKFVLATHSEYFRAMFQANMKESRENVIDWVEVFDSETVKDLLHFLYTGQTPPNIRVTFPTLVEAAHLCLLDELKDVCSETLIKIMNIDNAGPILEVAEKFDLACLRESTVLFVLDNYNQVLSTRGFEDIDSEIKTRLLKRVFQIIGKNNPNCGLEESKQPKRHLVSD